MLLLAEKFLCLTTALHTQHSHPILAQEREVKRKFMVVAEKGDERPLRVVGRRKKPG